MKLIVGLGNPGFRYRNTRHNIGFLVVKEISKRFHIPIKKKKFKAILGKGTVEDEKVILLLPQTYMNLSGEAVREVVKEEKIEPKDILVIYDDINLKFGLIRFREKGSPGGHKGLESAIEHVGSSEFPRLRIGVGKPHKIDDVVKFVLNPFDSEEKRFLKDIIDKAADCVVTWINIGPEHAMSRFNA